MSSLFVLSSLLYRVIARAFFASDAAGLPVITVAIFLSDLTATGTFRN